MRPPFRYVQLYSPFYFYPFIEQLFDYFDHERGMEMNVNEMELIEMIRGYSDPARAAVAALEVIVDYLTQHGSFAGQAPADRQESAGTD